MPHQTANNRTLSKLDTKRNFKPKPKEHSLPKTFDTMTYPTRSFDTIIYPNSGQHDAGATVEEERGRRTERKRSAKRPSPNKSDKERARGVSSPYKSDRERDRREQRPYQRPAPYKTPQIRRNVPQLQIDTVKANKSGKVMISPTSTQLYSHFDKTHPHDSRSSGEEKIFVKLPGTNLSHASGRKMLSLKDYPGESPPITTAAVAASTGGSPISTTSAAATIAGKSSTREEIMTELGTQTSEVRSFLDQLRDQVINGCWTEQWEARKALATEIEWPEDKELLEKGIPMKQLLEMKVEERGCLSDALMYGLYVFSHTFFTMSMRPPPGSPIHSKIDPAGNEVEVGNDRKSSILSEPPPTPSLVADSTTPATNLSSTSSQDDVLLALLSLDSDLPVRRWAQKSIRSKSEPEVSIGDRFLERLGEELLARRTSFSTVKENIKEVWNKWKLERELGLQGLRR